VLLTAFCAHVPFDTLFYIRQLLFSVLAGVLQLGQITFDSKQGDEDCSVVSDKALLQVSCAYSTILNTVVR
jgi:hypothetical protein